MSMLRVFGPSRAVLPAGDARASATAAAALATQIRLSGNASATAAAGASLSVPKPLAGAAGASSVAAGDLTGGSAPSGTLTTFDLVEG